MVPIKLSEDKAPVTTPGELASVILAASSAQTSEKSLVDPEDQGDFLLATDALNFHRVEWRLREEWGEVESALLEKVKAWMCRERGYEPEELSAALVATRTRPRLPYGWTAMDLAKRRLETRPIRLLNEELESSRYARGIVGLAVHLQEFQKEEPILLPVEQVREILTAKKVVVSGTITRLVELGLLEMTKANYNTGSAREFKFRGVEGKDYVFVGGKKLRPALDLGI